ncbi:SAP30-binding protein isoform X3 [Pseudochaenichthys georgianus]|uniref:SAP30-binding protein isoform X3 n=1 Tax=Pseudochaenichthys georgianus TaxID=52239 RepID=UPI00146E07A3|nr:SAP30-binding protein isoform X3 [Pseudochaenichthys georgianus]
MAASGKKSVLLSSLADYGDDSEPDSDPEPEPEEPAGGRVGGLVYSYGDDDLNRTEDAEDKVSGDEESRESNSLSIDIEESDEAREADEVEISELEKKDPNELVALFSEKVRNMSPDAIRIPPEPPGRCSSQLQDKIHKLYERKLQGDFDTNNHIQKKKEFRNPSIYEKLIQFCSIDELGTNYPKDMFDPHGWSEDSYYEGLAKSQKVEMDKLEKAKKERTKIEFVTGTKKGNNPSNTAASTNSSNTNSTSTEAQKRKSKWDSAIPVTLSQPAAVTTSSSLPAVVSVTTTASGTKTTVISAVGTILKKAKQ